MKNRYSLRQLALIMFGLVLTWAPLSAEVPAVLQHMPADSAVVSATQPLTTLNAKANTFAKKVTAFSKATYPGVQQGIATHTTAVTYDIQTLNGL